MDAAVPGAEVLGGEVGAGGLADVVVDVGRADRRAPRRPSSSYWNSSWPGIAWQRRTTRAMRGSSRSTSCSMPLLPRKRAGSGCPGRRRGGCAASSGRTSGWCARTRRCRRGPGSCRAAGPASPAPCRGAARADRQREVGLHALPDPRQRRAELEHALELAGVARQPPVGVIAVLLAAARVASGRLQVAVRLRADPDLSRRPAESPATRIRRSSAALRIRRPSRPR